MSRQTKFIAAAFAKLSADEQAEALKKINELNTAPSWRKQELSAGIIKEALDLGPVGSGQCPYCGK